MEQLLQNKIQLYKDKDGEYDLKLSYSGLDLFSQCPYRYSIKYNQGLFSTEQTIALEIGSICHKVLELKAQKIMAKEPVDYEALQTVLMDGYVGTNTDENEQLLGITDIKEKYGKDVWLEREPGMMNYEEKIALFSSQVIHKEIPCDKNDWEPMAAELPFQFIYKIDVPDMGERKVLFNGFIDRVDRKKVYDGTAYRVVDYKTSKKVYDAKKLSTPLQMIIYGLYIYLLKGELPSEYQYSFILLDEKTNSCTKGYLKRGLKKIDELLLNLFECKKIGKWDANGTPLCYWCDYNRQGLVNDPSVNNICERFCLWTPTNKTFECVDPWNMTEKMKEIKNKNGNAGVSYESVTKLSTGSIVNGRKFAW